MGRPAGLSSQLFLLLRELRMLVAWEVMGECLCLRTQEVRPVERVSLCLLSVAVGRGEGRGWRVARKRSMGTPQIES